MADLEIEMDKKRLLSQSEMTKVIIKLQAENTELRARLHRIGDARLEESVKHCSMGSENTELKEQIQQLRGDLADIKKDRDWFEKKLRNCICPDCGFGFSGV